METKFLLLNAIAHRTGIPAAWLKREADAGRIPCVRAGRRRFFDIAAVRAAILADSAKASSTLTAAAPTEEASRG
jgi:hypothetical protein